MQKFNSEDVWFGKVSVFVKQGNNPKPLRGQRQDRAFLILTRH